MQGSDAKKNIIIPDSANLPAIATSHPTFEQEDNPLNASDNKLGFGLPSLPSVSQGFFGCKYQIISFLQDLRSPLTRLLSFLLTSSFLSGKSFQQLAEHASEQGSQCLLDSAEEGKSG